MTTGELNDDRRSRASHRQSIGDNRTGILNSTDEHSALSVSGVSQSFGARRALDDVSLTVPAGSFTALLGINGAGKTTLFNLITRLYDNVSGMIEVRGHDVRTAPREALAQLGVVFQGRALDATMTVAQNFAYAGALHGMSRTAVRRRGAELLARIGLADRLHDRVRALSGGQARRVEIARALLHEPKLLLCDEATAGLDIQARADIVRQVHALTSERGVGVLWATHLIDEIEPDDRVVVLHRGRVLAAGPSTEIAGDAPLAEAFLAMTQATGDAA